MEGGSHDDTPPVKVEPTGWRKLSARARQLLHGGGRLGQCLCVSE